MKAFALRDRLKRKDAYDIYMVCKFYPGSPSSIIGAIQPYSKNKLVQEALNILRDRFANINNAEIKGIIDFLEEKNPQIRDIRSRDVYETLQNILIPIR